jgi:cell division protein FtsI/penicillin-binding protein 2
MFAAERLGEQRFYDYMQAFRLGRPTGIDLAGEVGGTLWLPGEEYYSPVNLYTNSFGQGVSVTPIQLINAVSAVANGGTLYKPYVMQEIRAGGQTVERNEPQVLQKGVIKPDTGRQIADMMAWGVENKLVARLARVPGYHVSVKTGTAEIPGCGGYCADQTLASAIGFAPSHEPKFTLYIALKNPRTSPWGENTASPAWGKIAKELLLYMKVQPTEPVDPPSPQP